MKKSKQVHKCLNLRKLRMMTSPISKKHHRQLNLNKLKIQKRLLPTKMTGVPPNSNHSLPKMIKLLEKMAMIGELSDKSLITLTQLNQRKNKNKTTSE